MELDERLGKIATGISVSDAIDAYLQEQPAPEETDLAAAKKSELLAIVELMFLMAAVDGEVQDEEVQQLRASIDALADIRAVPDLNLDDALQDLAAKLSAEGWKSRLEDAASRVQTPDAKDFAFRLSVGVAFVDDFVAHAEAAAIDSLARALELTADHAQTILREVHETLFGD